MYYYDILADEFCEENDQGEIVPNEAIVNLLEAVEEEDESNNKDNSNQETS